jgi:hypothetical protein
VGPDRPADLDDLFLSCRAENAKRAFGEAVACFRAGAYRACIVATWTAVVFDYLDKLRELDLAGNRAATAILASFDNARENRDIKLAQSLEAGVLSDAVEKFELLTPIEMEDLERLRLDRHRCAHPSLIALDDPYQPPAELARLHMRNAVTHLLSRPPLQGREAWGRIWADISSECFPDEHEAAVERIRHRLARARPTLICKLLIELTQKLLRACDAMEQTRARAALSAAISLHHQEAEKLFREKLDKLADSVPDEDLNHLISYCRHVGLAWSALGGAMRTKLELYVKSSTSMAVLVDAYTINDLQQAVLDQVRKSNDLRLVMLAERIPRGTEILDQIATRFESSKSSLTFSVIRGALQNEKLLTSWTSDHRKRLVRALGKNQNLRGYRGYNSVAREVLELCRAAKDTQDEWRSLFESYVESKDLVPLAREIRSVFPEFPDVPESEASENASDSSTM